MVVAGSMSYHPAALLRERQQFGDCAQLASSSSSFSPCWSHPKKRVSLRTTRRSCCAKAYVEGLPRFASESSRFCLQPVFPFPEPCPDSRTLDRWIQDAVVEIVKGLGDAPFLHFVFNTSGRMLQRQKVPKNVMDNPECWNYVKQSVFDVSPDGLILVQRLDDEISKLVADAAALPAEKVDAARECPNGSGLCRYRSNAPPPCLSPSSSSSASSDVWGVLVQGKNIMWTACYILQTTRVASSTSAVACTRFSLTRAQCYGPSLQAQLEKLWLL